MRKQQVILIVGAIVLVVAAVVLYQLQSRPAPAPAGRTVVEPADPLRDRGAIRVGGRDEVEIEGIIPPGMEEPVTLVTIRPGQILARVGGRAITLEDLIPMTPAAMAREHQLPERSFEFLLNEAINRELARQAAAAAGVGLNDAQHKTLEDARARMEEQYSAREVTWQDAVSGQEATAQILWRDPEISGPARIEFDLADMQAKLLLRNLLEQQGYSPGLTLKQLEEYYQNHYQVYGPLPDDPGERANAWERISTEIISKLSPEVRAAYEEALQRYLQELRAIYGVDIISPTS
jgi:hypothetical protein